MTARKPLPAETTEVASAEVPKEHLTYTAGARIETTRRAAVKVQPTQLRRPWRTTIRTGVQMLIALCALAPVFVTELHLDPEKLPWLAVPLAVAAGVTRLMAVPKVEQFLRRFAPWLSAAPRQ